MCTVTFIRSGKKVLITSNRDEKTIRQQAIPPRFYEQGEGQVGLLFPKDADAGGTWIALKNNGNAVVLLNGGFIKHIPSPPYRKSRGLVFLDIAGSENSCNAFEQLDLDNIEPFTVVIYEHGHLYECRWDGRKKHTRELERDQPHMWSSVTLYDHDTILKREQWFSQWLQTNNNPTRDEILHFHQFAGDGDKRNDLLMDRDGIYFTVSVTGIELEDGRASMKYIDMKDGLVYEQEVLTQQAV